MTATDTKGTTLDLDEVYALLNTTEGTTTQTITMDGSGSISVFSLPPGWNLGLKDKDGQDLTEAKVQIGNMQYSLTKDAILDVCAAVGIPESYVTRTPGPLIQSHLNYWATHSVDADIKMLSRTDPTHGPVMLATLRAGNIVPFSNTALLDEVVSGIESIHPGVKIKAQAHTSHTLHLTTIRLTMPEISRTVSAPFSENEDWSAGVQLHNSLTGRQILSLSPLPNETDDVARAMVSQHAQSSFNRKQMGQEFSTVKSWVAQSIGPIVNGADHDFDLLEMLPDIDIGASGLGKVVADIFRVYSVPLKVRTSILDRLTETEDTTYYGVVDAITRSANKEGIGPKHVTAVMETAGEVATSISMRCSECLRVQ